MADEKFLTPDEVVLRYRGEVTLGTLANWRALKYGPDFNKVGKAVLYPVAGLEAWDARNRVTCSSQRRPTTLPREGRTESLPPSKRAPRQLTLLKNL